MKDNEAEAAASLTLESVRALSEHRKKRGQRRNFRTVPQKYAEPRPVRVTLPH